MFAYLFIKITNLHTKYNNIICYYIYIKINSNLNTPNIFHFTDIFNVFVFYLFLFHIFLLQEFNWSCFSFFLFSLFLFFVFLKYNCISSLFNFSFQLPECLLIPFPLFSFPISGFLENIFKLLAPRYRH